jgi:hypothetical protein
MRAPRRPSASRRAFTTWVVTPAAPWRGSRGLPPVVRDFRTDFTIVERARGRPLLPALFHEKADFAVHAVHCDLIILDNAFGFFDSERIDAAKGLGGFLDRLPTGIVKAVRRLRDDLDTANDRGGGGLS